MNNEDAFYLFTKAMDLKYEDTVEAIYDLCQFIICTSNHKIWDELYDCVREKAQKLIDENDECDKRDCLELFEDDDWLQSYIQKVKQGEKPFLR